MTEQPEPMSDEDVTAYSHAAAMLRGREPEMSVMLARCVAEIRRFRAEATRREVQIADIEQEWHAYAEAPDDTLAPDALAYKRKLLDVTGVAVLRAEIDVIVEQVMGCCPPGLHRDRNCNATVRHPRIASTGQCRGCWQGWARNRARLRQAATKTDCPPGQFREGCANGDDPCGSCHRAYDGAEAKEVAQ
jgi:hypothetical protein